jgi:endo-1,4-beta-mannosidase
MKKSASFILFAMITASFMYTVLGYYLLFTFENERTWINTIKQIPNTAYKVIKVDASLYSFAEDTDFEYLDQDITINGVTYHVFKKKTTNNITSFYYLENDSQTDFDVNLKKVIADTDFLGFSNNKKPLTKLLKSFIKDFIFKPYTETVFAYTAILQQSERITGLEKPIHTGYLLDFFVPPKTT